MSLEDKVRFWTHAARFCIMIDRDPSGHLAEYLVLKEQNTLLAFLRPKGRGSTYMIGGADIAGVNYIKVFEFGETPLEVLGEVVEWAESQVKVREEGYRDYYPWRR